MNAFPKPICTGCNRHPADIPGYADEAPTYFGEYPPLGGRGQPLADLYAREDGTYNSENGHFLCDQCYIAPGSPTAPGGWVAP
jgi:hypothetical protein